MTTTELPLRPRRSQERRSLTAQVERFTFTTSEMPFRSQASRFPSTESNMPQEDRETSDSKQYSSPNVSSSAIAPTEKPSFISRRRPSALFGKSPFRFTLRHRCESRARDGEGKMSGSSSSTSPSSFESPPLSPTTTISTSPSSASRRARPELQCAQPSSDMDLGFPFGKPTPAGSTRGRDLGSVSESVSTSPRAFKAHPGTLVTISSVSAPCLPTLGTEDSVLSPQTDGPITPDSSSSSPTSKTGTKDYHADLRSNSSSSAEVKEPPKRTTTAPGYFYGFNYGATLETPIYKPESKAARNARLENIDYQARKLEQRARSIEQRERLLREGPEKPSGPSPTPGPAPPSSAPASPGLSCHPRASGESSRSSSSTDSASVALRSIRASFEARRSRELHRSSSLPVRKSDYDIFTDEDERGFIGDEPL
ncbi:hypothetical protein BDV96DRAFT_139331 [Lophiotrema nucula]|uniref:Uncharacterized protein n=1 Tax=Lophiotrema nucula TaxID=690887 RepID=A0A6A5ZTI4_9PLEO|nr:hypothetical protein BDV96DRAFT_139331 [Lophiotrema nucula]